MKLLVLLPIIFFVAIANGQVKDRNKTRQIEQLQQLKQTVSRKIDTLQLQLTEQADSMEELRLKMEQLKKESSNQDKPDLSSRDQASRTSQELLAMTNFANNLQKKFDQRLIALDKAVNLQKDLEEKISTLVRESNQ